MHFADLSQTRHLANTAHVWVLRGGHVSPDAEKAEFGE